VKDPSLALPYEGREAEYICYLEGLSDSPFRAKKAPASSGFPMEQKAPASSGFPHGTESSRILWSPLFKGDGKGISHLSYNLS